MTERERVKQFHEAMGATVNERPEMPSEAERWRRVSFTLEEVQEFARACGFTLYVDGKPLPAKYDFRLVATHPPDLAAMAQENADLRYISHGNDLIMGAPTAVFNEVHRANMDKRQRDGSVSRNEAGKVLKPEGWRPPDVLSALSKAAPCFAALAAEHHAKRAKNHPRTAYIRELLADEPGMCPFGCERPLPAPKRITCGHKECVQAYQRVYKQGIRELEATPAAKYERVCACGCGEAFTTHRRNKRYVAKDHASRLFNRNRATARAQKRAARDC